MIVYLTNKETIVGTEKFKTERLVTYTLKTDFINYLDEFGGLPEVTLQDINKQKKELKKYNKKSKKENDEIKDLQEKRDNLKTEIENKRKELQKSMDDQIKKEI